MQRLLKFSSYLLIAISVIYSVYWFATASIIEKKFGLAFEEITSGAAVSLGNVEVTGYPKEFDVMLQDFSVNVENTISWSTPEIHLVAASLNPTRLGLDLSRPHAIGGRWGDMTVDTERAQIIALFSRTTALLLHDLRFALEGAVLEHTQGFGVSAEKVIAVLKYLEGAESGVYRLETEITGANISKIVSNLPEGHARLGPIVGVVDVVFTSPWSAGGLTSELPVFRGALLHKLTAGIGSSDLALTGKLHINADATVSGQVTLTVTKWRELLTLAKKMGKIDAEGEEIFAEMLTEVEKLSGQPETLELPLIIKNGAVTYGVFTLGLVPPIR